MSFRTPPGRPPGWPAPRHRPWHRSPSRPHAGLVARPAPAGMVAVEIGFDQLKALVAGPFTASCSTTRSPGARSDNRAPANLPAAPHRPCRRCRDPVPSPACRCGPGAMPADGREPGNDRPNKNPPSPACEPHQQQRYRDRQHPAQRQQHRRRHHDGPDGVWTAARVAGSALAIPGQSARMHPGREDLKAQIALFHLPMRRRAPAPWRWEKSASAWRPPAA